MFCSFQSYHSWLNLFLSILWDFFLNFMIRLLISHADGNAPECCVLTFVVAFLSWALLLALHVLYIFLFMQSCHRQKEEALPFPFQSGDFFFHFLV
jgi:hypothetical protein